MLLRTNPLTAGAIQISDATRLFHFVRDTILKAVNVPAGTRMLSLASTCHTLWMLFVDRSSGRSWTYNSSQIRPTCKGHIKKGAGGMYLYCRTPRSFS